MRSRANKTSFSIALVRSESLFGVENSLVSICITFVHIQFMMYYNMRKVKDSCKFTLNQIIKRS